MPTASTSQIACNYECIEPVMSNIYSRRVLAGEFMVVNRHLINDLILLNKWNPDIKDKIITNDGCAQVFQIPKFLFKKDIKQLGKQNKKIFWIWRLIEVIYLSISKFNLFVEAPNFKILSSMHFYGWKRG